MTFVNKIGELRPNQFITSFGPGAISDAVNDSVTVLDLDYWKAKKNRGKKIKDSRLAAYLKVNAFYMPKTGTKTDIPVVSFPYAHVCSDKGCGCLFDIRKPGNFDAETYIKLNGVIKCPKCGKQSYPARLITVCKAGHMDDFPWSWWVHKGDSSCTADLVLKSSGRTTSLGELTVYCPQCDAKRSLYGATTAQNMIGYKCTGHFPQRPAFKNIDCSEQISFCQRGASNVYFSVTRSALSLPGWTSEIMDAIAENREIIESYAEDFGELGLTKAYEKFFKERWTREEFDKALSKTKEEIKDMLEIKKEEYNTIIHHKEAAQQNSGIYFKAEDEPVSEKLKPFFSRIIKVHRLREVMALVGYTRLFSPEPDAENTEKIVKLNSNSKNKWLPAVEIHGEGIFLELNKNSVKQWIEQDAVKQRSDKYRTYYAEYCHERGWEEFQDKNGEYVLLHTLAHLLIKQMALSSGYASASIKERIYSDEDMCGILLYTGAADKEGSLGGLVELGKINKFEKLLVQALENAQVCTTDPECFEKEPAPDHLNGAACHSCCMISETSCECGNRLLDRALLIPLYKNEGIGFFKDLGIM